jgi:hypothetical protein
MEFFWESGTRQLWQDRRCIQCRLSFSENEHKRFERATRILDAIGQDNAASAQALLAYDELRRLAARRLAREAPRDALDATALVHRALLRLVGGDERNWDNHDPFFAAAAEAVRRATMESTC